MLSSSKKMAPYGSWQSPINAKMVIGGNCKSIWELQHDKSNGGGRLFWVEQTFPTGRRVLFERGAHGKPPVRWSDDKTSVANSVHEYGGGSFCVGNGRVFICHGGGISELDAPLAAPRPIVQNKEGEDVRHADPVFHDKFIYAVQERHEGKAEPKNCVVRLNVETCETEMLAEGADFYACPRPSPDGRWLAWIQWNKPYMPWDVTSLYLMEISENGAPNFDTVKQLLTGHSFGGIQWANGLLHFFGDQTGFWNVYQLCPTKESTPRNLYPVEKEIGQALWNLGDDRPYVVTDENSLVFNVDHNLFIKQLLNGGEGSIESDGFTVFSHLSYANGKVAFLAAGPARSKSVVELDVRTNKIEIVRESRSSAEINQLPISAPSLKTFISDGVQVQGYFYPPTNPDYKAPEGTLPPVLLLAHGGPTAHTVNGLELKIQYFTSRGWAVFDVNYRGSTGRGREFRDMLLGNWGVADREDMVNGAQFLVDNGLVDSKMICIMGSSAGGYLVLSSLFHPRNPFAAAVSIYGVADLENLFKQTHKFEADYTVRLLAPYPEGLAIYQERSPIHNLDKINTPVVFLHGLEDPVVPCEESKSLHESLRKKGVPTALKLFPGEAHGFKSSEAVTQTYDISYYFLCQILGITPSVECDLEIDNFDNNK